MSITDKLPIDSDLAYRLADEAIGLFLENRDQHGQDEVQARANAVLEIAEGASAEMI